MNDQIRDIAAQNGLGRPEAVYGPADGGTPWDRELHLFEHGFVVRLPDGRVQGHRWESVTVLKDVIDPFRSVYSLTDGASPPVVIDGFERPDQWGPAIHGAVLRTHLPQARAALQAGRTVAFGEIAASPQALLTRTGALPWQEISEIGVENGVASVKVREQWRPLTTTHVRDLPNFLVLFTLIEERKGGPRAPASKLGWVIGGVASFLVIALVAGGIVVAKRLVKTGVREGITAAQETPLPSATDTPTSEPTLEPTPEPTPTEPTETPFDASLLDDEDTDQTPITTGALLADTFTTKKGVRYNLKGTRQDDCPAWFQEGKVRTVLRGARCKEMISGVYASANSSKNNRIMVVIRVIPFKDASTAKKTFDKLPAGSRDWGFMCPLKGPGSGLCANGRGSWSSAYIWGWTQHNHRYVVATLALYENLANGSSTKPWLTDASKAALDAAGPMVYHDND
ncbi:DUF6585 family protein [Nonomuraea sp. NPDC050790]|uniref:DUF6585 family protein n=1 Tax=Nonomuraea sp. NPDC050790 TaxID=3364371 RepID=UPI0037BAC4DA